MKNIILLSATLAAAVLGTEAAKGEAVEVRWNAGDGDMSVLGNWITHAGDWNFIVPVTAVDNESDLRFYGSGEKALTMSGNMTAHSLKVAAGGGDSKVTIDATGRTLSFADSASAPEWGDWQKGISVAGTEDNGVWRTGWLVLSGGTFSGNVYLRAAGEGNAGEGHARLTVTGSGTRVEGVSGDVSCGDSATDCVLEVLDGAYVLAGRGLRIGDNSAAGNNVIRVSGSGSRLEMRPTGDASYLPSNGHDNSVIVENGGVLANVQNSGGWYGTTYVGMSGTATGNAVEVQTGGVLDFSSGGELRVGFNTARENRLVVTGQGSEARMYGQVAIGSGGADDNEMVVSAGGRFIHSGYSDLYIGWENGSCGNSAIVTGAGSELVMDNRFVYIGIAGGCSNSLVVANGGYAAAKHFFIGSGAGSDRNEVRVSGSGSTLATSQYDISIGNGGRNNALHVEDGATLAAARSIFIGGGEGVSDLSVCTGNALRIFNATLSQPVNYDITINGGCRLTVGGSQLVTDTPWLHASEDSEIEFMFDEEGIAPFVTRWETFLAKADGTPAPSTIIIDARKFVKMQGVGTFTLMKAAQGHSARKPDGGELTPEGYEALNAAMMTRTVCYPTYLRPSFDMAHSTITVDVPRMGLSIVIR